MTSSASAAPSAAIGANCASNHELCKAGVVVTAICAATKLVIAVAAPISQPATASRMLFPTPLTTELTPLAIVLPTLQAALVSVLTAPPMIGIPTLHGAPPPCAAAACACTAAWVAVPA